MPAFALPPRAVASVDRHGSLVFSCRHELNYGNTIERPNGVLPSAPGSDWQYSQKSARVMAVELGRRFHRGPFFLLADRMRCSRSVKPPSSVKAVACAAIWRSSSAHATPMSTSAAFAAISG